MPTAYTEVVSVTFFMVCCLILSAARWFFKPSGVLVGSMEYMYPARKVCTVLYLQAAFLLVYVLDPYTAQSQLLREIFLPMFFPYAGTIMFRTYYGSVMGWKLENWVGWMLFVPMPVLYVVLCVGGLLPQWLDDHSLVVFKHIALTLSVVYTVLFMIVMLKIKQNSVTYVACKKGDFPLVFAWKTSAMAFFAIVVVWAGYLFDFVRNAAYVILGLETVLLMIMVLPTHRRAQRLPADGVALEKASNKVRDKNLGHVAEQIRLYVENKKAFLNPKLTIADVADNCDYSRTYVSKVIKDDFGGFYKYVNGLRHKYLADFMKENPGVSLDNAVEQCGFASRGAYYNAKKYVEG